MTPKASLPSGKAELWARWVWAKFCSFSNSQNFSSGFHRVAPGDHCYPLPRQLLRTLAQLGAPCCRPSCCGFLPGFLFKVFLTPDICIIMFFVKKRLRNLTWLKNCTMWLLGSRKCIAAQSKTLVQLAGSLTHSFFWTFNLFQVQSFGLNFGPGEKEIEGKGFNRKLNHPVFAATASQIFFKYSRYSFSWVPLIFTSLSSHNKILAIDFWLLSPIKTKLKEIMMAFVYKHNLLYIYSLHLIAKFITMNQTVRPKLTSCFLTP